MKRIFLLHICFSYLFPLGIENIILASKQAEEMDLTTNTLWVESMKNGNYRVMYKRISAQRRRVLQRQPVHTFNISGSVAAQIRHRARPCAFRFYTGDLHFRTFFAPFWCLFGSILGASGSLWGSRGSFWLTLGLPGCPRDPLWTPLGAKVGKTSKMEPKNGESLIHLGPLFGDFC